MSPRRFCPSLPAAPHALAAVLALSLTSSCATAPAHSELRHDRRAGPVRLSDSRAATSRAELGPIEGRHLEVDSFFGLLVRAGVPPAELPRDRSQLTPDDAARLLTRVLAAEVPLRDFGPWRMAAHLLLELIQGPEPVSRQRLHQRMRGFAPLLVLRPDGYLVRATTGRAVQRAGEVHFEGGALRAEGFEVGPFYMPRKGFLYPVDGDLEIHPDAVLAGGYSPDEDTLGPLLEGAGQAVIDSVTGIVSLVLHPRDSLEGLTRLPAAVRTLLENSPQYAEHFWALPHGERVRTVSRLITHVALMCGTAGAGTTRLASAGSKLGNLRVPVLSLSAHGTLALRRVALPAGGMVTAVSAAPGALYIVHMASRGAGGASGSDGDGRDSTSWKPPPGGPGQWVRKNEGMPAHARKYQSQVTGAPEGWVYRVEHGGEKFDFDGYSTKDGLLIDAKSHGYDDKFLDSLEPKFWFKDTGAREMVENALRQLRVANGVPIRWYVAEAKATSAIRRLLERNGIDTIEVVHMSARP